MLPNLSEVLSMQKRRWGQPALGGLSGSAGTTGRPTSWMTEGSTAGSEFVRAKKSTDGLGTIAGGLGSVGASSMLPALTISSSCARTLTASGVDQWKIKYCVRERDLGL